MKLTRPFGVPHFLTSLRELQVTGEPGELEALRLAIESADAWVLRSAAKSDSIARLRGQRDAALDMLKKMRRELSHQKVSLEKVYTLVLDALIALEGESDPQRANRRGYVQRRDRKKPANGKRADTDSRETDRNRQVCQG